MSVSAANWYASEGDWLIDVLRGGGQVTRMPVAQDYGATYWVNGDRRTIGGGDGQTQIYRETGWESGGAPMGVSWPIWAIGGALVVLLILRK